jgi:ferredoxin
MIIAEQKPLDEIRHMLMPYGKVLIAGCGTCMTVCDAGGEREVSFLSNALRLAEIKEGNEGHTFAEITVKRQCDVEFLEMLADRVQEAEVILSLGCGIGVQALAERFPNIPVLPGVNTSFMGMADKWGVWDERCSACGDCRLENTGGICPITRCTKGILNGPCAGTKNGKCEVSKEMDCAWILIYKRLEKLGQLEKMRRYYPARNYRAIPRPHRITLGTSANTGEANG